MPRARRITRPAQLHVQLKSGYIVATAVLYRRNCGIYRRNSGIYRRNSGIYRRNCGVNSRNYIIEIALKPHLNRT